MKPPTPSKKPAWQDRIRPALNAVMPATRVVEGVARIAVQLQRPSVLGVVGMAAAGANALRDMLSNTAPVGYELEVFCSRAQLIDVFKKSGADVRASDHRAPDCSDIVMRGRTVRIRQDGSLFSDTEFEPQWIEWLRQMIDREFPKAVEIRPGNGRDQYASAAMPLASLSSVRGREIWEATKPMLGVGRAILLTGKPGVGKTTMAQEIARLADLGRVVQLHGDIVGTPRSGSVADERVNRGYRFEEGLALISPGVVIVDDIDKINLSIGRIEQMRRVAKLVIFTANNGDQDEVLDNAMMRPARIDEVFEVIGERCQRRTPFDRLSDEQWQQVREWPIAFLNELEERLIKRQNSICFDDLSKRVSLRTRSVNGIY